MIGLRRKKKRPKPPLLAPYKVQVRIQVPETKCGRIQVWQGGKILVETSETDFTATVKPGSDFHVVGRTSAGKPYHLPAVVSVISRTQIPQDDGRWVRYERADPAQLPPPRPAMHQVPQIEQIMGFKIRYGPQGEALLVALPWIENGNAHEESMGSDGLLPADRDDLYDGVVVGVHEVRPSLERNLLSRVGANPPRFQIVSQVIPMDDASLKRSIHRARRLNGSGAYQKFLDAFEGYYDPSGDWMRRLVVTAPANSTLNRPTGAPTGLAKTRPLTAFEWARLAQFSQTGIHREGMDGLTKHPLQEAWVDPKFSYNDFQALDKRTAYVDLRLSAEELAAALEQPVNISYWFRNEGGDRLFAAGVAQLHGDPQRIASLQTAIPGRCQRIRGVQGDDPAFMERVHYAFLPGSPHQPPQGWHHIFNWREFLETLGKPTDAVGARSGDLVIGPTWGGRERLITYNSGSTNSIIFLGPTGSGKTTKALEMAFSRTPLVITLHVSRPKEDWTGKWADRLVGQFLPWKGQDPKSPQEFRAASAELEEEVDAWIDELSEEWEKGDFSSLPMVIRRESGNTFLYFRYLDLILQKFLAVLGDAAQKHDVPVVVVIDDIISAAKTATDPNIGEEAPNAAKGLRESCHDAVNVCRTANISLYVTGHGFQSVAETYGTGFFQDFPLALVFSSETDWVHKRAEIFYPPLVIPDLVGDVEEDDEGNTLERPSGWRGYFNCEIDRDILDAMGVPKKGSHLSS